MRLKNQGSKNDVQFKRKNYKTTQELQKRDTNQSDTHRKKKKEKFTKNQATETQQCNHSKYECSGRQVYILTPPRMCQSPALRAGYGGGRARVNMLIGQPRHDLTYISTVRMNYLNLIKNRRHPNPY